MKHLGCIKMDKEIVDELLKYHSVNSYIDEGIELMSKSLKIMTKENKTEEDYKKLENYTSRITELNFLIGMLKVFSKED